MSWDFLTTAFDTYFVDAKEANACEDQWLAGFHGDPYPASDDLDYDCGSEFYNGMQAGIEAGSYDSPSGDSGCDDAGGGDSD
ncbi:hypothetical protein KOR42_36380 [Thalassoglobus neptunius]|uniref:Uncharacterized protein n=1 Tax=Thalassoglobus neptunius TaxID=1938619 RepID=A0A5C5WJR6_9PLAN|nr:hypothetical protein [Thalassoglobus neptunius]TWT50092.1 hypothetical protein KOR42_36380 [Thalassoglobus neptunius]